MSDKTYKCELCCKIEKWLFALCACDECDKRLREIFPDYKAERERIESEAGK